MTLEPIVIIQALWGAVLLFVGFAIKRISDEIKDNSRSIQTLAEKLGKLHIEVLQDFAPKPDFDAMRQRIHDLSNDVSVLMSRAGLESHSGD